MRHALLATILALFASLVAPPALAVPIKHADRVKDSTTTTGTGALTLSGTAASGFRSFASVYSTVTPDYFQCAIIGGDGQWEISRCHLSAATTLVRDEVYSSSTGSSVNFNAGTKSVFVTLAAQGLEEMCLVDGTRVFTGPISFEGATANAFETTFAITDPTDDRTVTFQDASGTVALLSDITAMSDADILDAVKRVDGAGSGLDADTVDGMSSAAFAVVAGGNAFAASNTYAANDIQDADVVDTLTCSNYLPLAGGTMTGGLVFNGVTNDVTATSGQTITVLASGSGAFVNIGGGDGVSILDASGGVRGRIVSFAVSGSPTHYTGSGANSGVFYSSSIGSVAVNRTVNGRQDDAAANSMVGCFGDTINATAPSSIVELACSYGGGAFGIPKQQAITISTGTDTTSPTSSQVELTCTTPPCVYQPGETSVVDGWHIKITNNESIGGDDITITDNSGSTDTVTTRGRATITLVPGDVSSCSYNGFRWGCQ